MGNASSPQLVRVLVDFYQGGRLLYKKDNLYPSDEHLQLLKARNEAEEYEPPKPATPAKQAKAVKPSKAADDESAAAADAAPTRTDSAESAEKPAAVDDASSV